MAAKRLFEPILLLLLLAASGCKPRGEQHTQLRQRVGVLVSVILRMLCAGSWPSGGSGAAASPVVDARYGRRRRGRRRRRPLRETHKRRDALLAVDSRCWRHRRRRQRRWRPRLVAIGCPSQAKGSATSTIGGYSQADPSLPRACLFAASQLFSSLLALLRRSLCFVTGTRRPITAHCARLRVECPLKTGRVGMVAERATAAVQ